MHNTMCNDMQYIYIYTHLILILVLDCYNMCISETKTPLRQTISAINNCTKTVTFFKLIVILLMRYACIS